jgi:hypothetical protein
MNYLSAIEQITDNNPELGAVLIRTMRIGTFCSYIPEPSRTSSRTQNQPLRRSVSGLVTKADGKNG